MSNKTSGGGLPNPIAEVIREMASAQADPLERKSLLESAAKVEAADAMLREAHVSMQQQGRRVRLEMDALSKRNDLPRWVVVSVLLAFAVFLVCVALKHHV